MLVVPEATPLGSVMCVEVRPSLAAVVFILATNALTVVASHSARRVAMSAPESTSNPSRASSSVSVSPAVTGTSDSWLTAPS